MEKLVYLLWRPEGTDPPTWSDRLHAVARGLVGPDTRGVQLNVADAEVAGAQVVMATFDRPVEAVLSVWVDSVAGVARRAIEDEVAPEVARLAGYLVTESVPLAQPEVAPGGRSPGFANIALLRRPTDLAVDAWLTAWQGHHTQVALDVQSTTGYVQNAVVRAVTPDAPRVDAIVEEQFPIEALADFHAFFATGGDDAELGRRMAAMGRSVATFGADRDLDVIATSRYLLAPAAAAAVRAAT